MPRRGERGVMLLDAMLALGILATALVALVGVGASAYAELGRVRRSEREFTDAHRLLGALSLLTRDEYDQRLGVRPIGVYLVEITRPERGLYRIALRPGERPLTELLTTVAFRPDTVP